MPALSYRDVKDIYDSLHDAGAVTQTLPEWSRQYAADTGSDAFAAGLSDNWLKRLNTSIDRVIEWTGAPKLTGEFGAGIGSLFGMEDVGRRHGETIPRMTADIASFLIPGLGQAGAAARVLPAMAMSGMGSYAETGSPAAGVASAALMGILPGATNKAEQWALEKFGARKMVGDVVAKAGTTLMDSGVTEGFSRYMPQNFAQGAGAYTVGQGAAMGLMGGSTIAQQALSGEEVSNPFTGEFWLSQGIQNLPFMLLHGGKKLAGPSYGKAIEATGQALLEGHDALAWKQLQRDVADYGKAKDKPVGPAAELTPKAQDILDRIQGKPPTEEDFTAANGWLMEVESARRRAEQEPTDEEAQKNLVRVQSGLDEAVTSGEVPFTAFVERGVPTTEVEGRVSHVTEGGKVFADIVNADGTTERIGFPSTLMPDKYVVGQEGKFKIPGDERFVERNVQQNPAYLAHVEALRAKEEARKAQEALQQGLNLKKAVPIEHAIAQNRQAGNQLELVDGSKETLNPLGGVTNGEILTLNGFVDKKVVKRLLAHDGKVLWENNQDSVRLRADELDKVAHTASEEEIRLDREYRTEDMQKVGRLVAKFNSAPIIGEKGNPGKIDIFKDIDAIMKAHGMPSLFDRQAVRYGTLAGVTAHNLGVVLHKGEPVLKAALQEFKVMNSRQNETDSATKSLVSLDAEKAKGDKVEAEAVKTQAEMDSEPDTEEQHATDTVFENSQTDDGIVEGFQGDLAVKVIQDSDAAKVAFGNWKDKGDISFREEMGRALVYLRTKVAAGGKFKIEDFVDALPGPWTVDAGDLSKFGERPHVKELEREFANQLNRPGTPLAAKARAERYSAGSDFIWSVNPEVATPKQAPGGKVDEAWFVKNAGIGQDKGVPPLEVEILKALDKAQGLGIFDAGKVDMEKLKGAMSDEKVWPKVTEVTEFGPGTKGSNEANAALEHYMDTYRNDIKVYYDYEEKTWHTIGEGRSAQGQPEISLEQAKQLSPEFVRLTQAYEKELDSPDQQKEGGAQWMSMSSAEHGVGNPHGYFELAVAVPRRVLDEAQKSEYDKLAGRAYHGEKLTDAERARKTELEAVTERSLFDGQHEPFPANTLIHLRGYFAEHPTEGRVLVLDEVQSDWEQARRKTEEKLRIETKLAALDKLPDATVKGSETYKQREILIDQLSNPSVGLAGVSDHPLLPVAHVLGLKAALAKIAKESPGTKLMVSGPETAMMVEGHDKAAKDLFVTPENIQKAKDILATKPDNSKFYKDDLQRIIEGKEPQSTDWGKRSLIEAGLVPDKEVSQSGGMTTAYANTYYVLRDAEGKTVKGKVFRTEKEAQEAATALEKSKQSEPLTGLEREAIDFYTAGSVGFNSPTPQGKTVELIKSLDSAVQKAEPLQTDVLYRAVDQNYFENQKLAVGSSVKPPGFISTSKNRKSTQSTDYVSDSERVTITIKGVKGVKGVDVDNVLRTNPGADKNTRIGEQEILLGRGLAFVIESYDGKNSVWRLVAKEEKPSFSVAPQTGTLVSAAQKLTGGEGQPFVGKDVHKMVKGQDAGNLFDTEQQAREFIGAEGTVVKEGDMFRGFEKPVGSPVFRDPSGNPETRVTGTVFDTDKSTANYEANGGFTLSRPSYAKKKWVATPEAVQTIADRKLNGTGHDLARVISDMEDADPADRAMAEILIRNLPETLSRVTAEFDANGNTVMTPMLRENRGEITFSPWNITESNKSWAGTTMEELQHHVGAIALLDPKNIEARNGFESLRKRVITGLSGEEKDAFDKQTKLYKENPARIIHQGEVHSDLKTEDLVYALQNVDEFFANGNRAHAVRERLKLMEPKKGWLSEFVKNVKMLFGIGPKETAFDEFLYHTKQIMDSSEAVAKSYNYLEAHFGQLGYDSVRANDAAQVAMRLMNKHGVGKGDPQALFAELAKPSDMDSNELSQARNKFKRLMASPDDKEMGNTAMLFNDPDTGKAVENWFMEQLDTPSSVSYFKALPQSVQDYLSLRVEQMQDVLSGIHNLAKNGSAPVTDLLAPKPLERTAKEMLEKLQPFVRRQVAVRTAVSQLRALDSFGTENMLQVMGRPLAAKTRGETPDGFVDEKIGFLRKFTLQLGQWAQSNPLVKEVLVRITGSRNLAQKFAESAQHDVMGYDPANPGVYNPTIAEGWRKWLEDGRNKDAADKINSTNQIIGKDKVRMLAADNPAMVAATKGIAPEVLAKAHQFVRQMAIGTQKGQAHILHRMGENGTVQGSKLVLLQEENLNVETAMTASRNVLDALVALKENPSDATATSKLQQAQAVLQPKTMEQLMETQDKMSKVLLAAKLHFKNNDGWISAQRRGEFLYKGFRGTEEISMGADSDKEVLAHARKHGVKVELDSKKPNDSGDYAEMNWSQDFIDKAKAYDENVYQAARAAGASDEVLSTLQKMAVGSQILKDQHVSYDIGAGETKGRTLSKGGDIVPFTDHFFAWLKGSPAYWNKRLIKEQVEMMLLAPEYRAAPETAKGLRQWLNGFLMPDPKGMQALQKAVTTFALGGNVGFLVNNVFQVFLRGIPEMMSHGVGFLQAFRGVSGALKDAVKSFTKVNGYGDLSKGLPDSNERWFMERLNNDLITDPQLFDETEMRKGYDSYKLTQSLNASKPKTFGQWVASVGGAYSNVALSMVRHGERANTEATALGAFRALMRTFPEKGREWAEGKARDIHQATNDPGGRFNRAIGLYDNAGPFSRSAAMMTGALQSYTFGTIQQLIRNFEKGWKGSSLTPAEKYAGRKAFLTQLGLQFAVAGALGMPFVSGALALINQVDPSLEINKNVRGLMQQFFSEDGKDGHPLTDMMMSGLPSQLGWDMQSRLSSGELIPGVSERDGFQVSNLAGVPASLATQMAGGVKQILNGQGSGLMAFVPPGLRSQIRLATGTAGEDNRGRPVLTDMTAGEKVGLALGMRPTRLREFNDAQRMEKDAEQQDNIRKGQWRQEAAGKVLKGEFGTVIGELKTQLSANPKLDVSGEVRQIAKYAEDQAFPRDLRREAKGDQRSALLQQWNLAPSQPTEEQRLQFRTKVEQQFGVRSEGGQALMNARMMDTLRLQHPNATRVELRGMLPKAPRVQPVLPD